MSRLTPDMAYLSAKVENSSFARSKDMNGAPKIGAIRRYSIGHFLLVVCSNDVPILHRFRDITTFAVVTAPSTPTTMSKQQSTLSKESFDL